MERKDDSIGRCATRETFEESGIVVDHDAWDILRWGHVTEIVDEKGSVGHLVLFLLAAEVDLRTMKDPENLGLLAVPYDEELPHVWPHDSDMLREARKWMARRSQKERIEAY